MSEHGNTVLDIPCWQNLRLLQIITNSVQYHQFDMNKNGFSSYMGSTVLLSQFRAVINFRAPRKKRISRSIYFRPSFEKHPV